jgi:phospholipid/cholesterol/gamma-HCH transport system permease protein
MYERIRRPAKTFGREWNRVGRQARFYVTTLRSIGDVVVFYKGELMRVIAQMSLGVGALVLIGGTVVIVAFLVTFAASTTAVYAHKLLAQVGIEALAGFASAFINVRIGVPLISTIGLSATVGAGATAQLGAMRISEEIDALEVMGVRSIAYLASSRVLAGVIVVIPLYCVALLMGFFGYKFTIFAYGQSAGAFNHYFNTFLVSTDVLWSLFIVICAAIAVMLVHTYYGFNATGGPVGVGEAVGRATRASMIVSISVLLLVSMAIYGPTGNFHLSE